MRFFPARYLRVGQRFVYLGGTFMVLSRSNKGTIGAVNPLYPDLTYTVISGNRSVRLP